MRYYFLPILFFYLLTNSISSQQSIMANYGTILSFGVGESSGIDFNSSLDYDGEQSLYTFQNIDLENGTSLLSKDIEKKAGGIHMIKWRVDAIGNLTWINHKSKKVINRGVVGNKPYFIDRSSDKIEWNIGTEKKTIGAYTCQIATTTYLGRNYTAWFTSEIPVKLGPWLLHGLPGLIVEAYDQNKEVHFYLKGITFPKTSPYINSLEKESIVSSEDYWKAFITFEEKRRNNSRLITEKFGGTYYTPKYYESIDLYPKN